MIPSRREADQLEKIVEILLANRPQEAAPHALRWVELEPNNYRAQICLARSLDVKQDVEGARASYLAAFELAPDVAYVRGMLGRFLRRVGEYEAAWEHLQAALALEPEDADWHDAASRCLFAMGNHEGARHEARKAVALDPDNPARRPWAVALDRLRWGSEYSSVHLDELRAALAGDPENAEIHYDIGRFLLADFGDETNAEHHFRLALELEPTDVDYQDAVKQIVEGRDFNYRVLRAPLFIGSKLWQHGRHLWHGLQAFGRYWALGTIVVLVVWTSLATVLLGPLAWLYGWFVFAPERAMTDSRPMVRRFLRLVARLPRLARQLSAGAIYVMVLGLLAWLNVGLAFLAVVASGFLFFCQAVGLLWHDDTCQTRYHKLLTGERDTPVRAELADADAAEVYTAEAID